MLIDLNKPLLSRKGEPMKAPEGKEVTIAEALASALETIHPNETLTGPDKHRRGRLAIRIGEAEEKKEPIELTLKELKELDDVSAQAHSIAAYTTIHEYLEAPGRVLEGKFPARADA